VLKYYAIFLTLISVISAQEADSLKDSVIVKEQVSLKISPEIKSLHDPWFSQDKFLHFSACAAISGITYHFYVCRLKKDKKLGKVYSISITALIGIGKEIYDKKKKGHFSWKDMFWNGVGLTAGYLLFIHDF